MSWQLDLTDSPIHALQIIEGEPRQLAAWLSATCVQFFAVENGAYYGELNLEPPGSSFDLRSNAWQQFTGTLHTPHGAYLPSVTVADVTLLTSYDGRLRLYCDAQSQLILESDGQPGKLPRQDDLSVLIAVALDRDMGTVATLSAAGKLHLYQQQVYIGQFALEHGIEAEACALFAPDAGGEVIVVGDMSVQIVDLSGEVRFRIVIPTPIQQAACTPTGNLLVLGERTSTLLHIYDSTLNLLFQGRASRLLEQAPSVQLLPRNSEHSLPLEALAIDDDGVLAFALGGVICCSHVDSLPALPASTRLL